MCALKRYVETEHVTHRSRNYSVMDIARERYAKDEEFRKRIHGEYNEQHAATSATTLLAASLGPPTVTSTTVTVETQMTMLAVVPASTEP